MQPGANQQNPATSAANIQALQAVLSEYDVYIVVDKSGSMTTPDMKGKSRWEYMQETVLAFTRDVEKIDTDGIGVVFFSGSGIIAEDSVTSARVVELFSTNRPTGSTPLDEALNACLKLASKSKKKKFFTIFTDGSPDDQAAAEAVIRNQANRQTADDECTFLFVQVGHDAAATTYLQKLDDALTGAKFDIVDAKTIDQAEKFASTAELIAHAIND